MVTVVSQDLLAQIRSLPHNPGVYLFKDISRQIIYIGKAKDLKNRVKQYIQRLDVDVKAYAILSVAAAVDYVEVNSELEALLLEAQLIKNHQPRFNVLLKDGQPFLYLAIMQKKGNSLPGFEIVRNKKGSGVFFGPFLEKGHARTVFDFLQKTFRLKLCNKKIDGGCLQYHLGICAGYCRPDFDEKGYKNRLMLAQLALQKGYKKFLDYLQNEVLIANKKMAFEQSRDLNRYLQAFKQVFSALRLDADTGVEYVRKDIWLLSDDHLELVFFEERDTILKKRFHFYFYPYDDQELLLETIKEHFLSVYRERVPAQNILTNIDFGQDGFLFEEFLQQLYELDHQPVIVHPEDQSHYNQLLILAKAQLENDKLRRISLSGALKKLFMLAKEPIIIDCFDISHKQGFAMVGACVRFTNGAPDKEKFRRFKIKTVSGQNDYASLREIVARRYRDGVDFPDLILIDGGKGQLHAVEDLFPEVEFASLAKREETVFSKHLPEGKKLDLQSFVGQMLVALRDYTHHFAISYHRKLFR